jgi:hypothetical protein
MATTLRTLACAGAMLVLLMAAASAQAVNVSPNGMGFSPFKEPDKKPMTQDEIDRQKRLDDAYKSATNKIPDQQSSDPWATVRPSGSAPAAKKKQPQ